MAHGHHGANHPVIEIDSGRVMITSQNHGFCIDEASLPANARVTHRSLFDGTNQGIELTDAPAFSFQGHPEAAPGPHDATEVYEEGLCLPIMKLYKRGVPTEEIFQILTANVRAPDMALGDIRAMVTGNEVGARLLAEFMDEYGLADLSEISATVQDRVEHALVRAARNGTYVGVVMVDLDDFKVVNDLRGHAAGDTLLREVCARLTGTLRSSTTIARLGGDEFAVLVDDLDDPGQVDGLAERLLRPFEEPFVLDGEEILTSASIGMVIGGRTAAPLDYTELLRCADLALYAAKERGKGRVEIYHDDLHTRMVKRATCM